MGQETQRESLPETLQSVIDEIGRKSPAELAAAEREPDTAIIARKPEAWISALRPRVVDAEAFAIEQESWRDVEHHAP